MQLHLLCLSYVCYADVMSSRHLSLRHRVCCIGSLTSHRTTRLRGNVYPNSVQVVRGNLKPLPYVAMSTERLDVRSVRNVPWEWESWNGIKPILFSGYLAESGPFSATGSDIVTVVDDGSGVTAVLPCSLTITDESYFRGKDCQLTFISWTRIPMTVPSHALIFFSWDISKKMYFFPDSIGI